MRAISIKWPYVAFQGLFNTLIVINSFDRRMVHRIELDQEWESIVISATYITETNDIFIIILKENMYFLYMVDLDQANISEDQKAKGRYKLKSYRPGKPILTYRKNDVNCQQLKDFHVRGS